MTSDFCHDDSQQPERQSGPRFEKLTYGAGHSKRYGRYFSSRPSIIETRGSQDSDGTSWEFVTPDTDSAFEGTEAQRVALMYRLRSKYSGHSDTTLDSVPPNYSNPDTLAVKGSLEGPQEPVLEKQYTPIVGSKDLRVNLDEARQRGLLAVFQEAMDTAKKYNQTPGGNARIICPRPGCGNTLANANALLYHLHIHDIDDNLVVCVRCNSSYEHPFDMHSCRKKPSRFDSYWKLPSVSVQRRARIKYFGQQLISYLKLTSSS